PRLPRCSMCPRIPSSRTCIARADSCGRCWRNEGFMNSPMHDNDDAMDRLLRESMAAEAPELSPAFDAAVLDNVRGPRLAPWGRAIMGAYVVIATAFTVWALHDVSALLMAVSLGGGALVAFALRSYARALVIERA